VEKNRTIDYTGLGMNILVIQAWFPGKALTMNFPGWSLAVEFFFYAIYPFLFNYIYKKRDITSLVLPILLIWIISQYVLYVIVSSSFYQGYPSKSYEFAYYFPIMHLNQFLTGNLAGLFFHKYKKKAGNYDIPLVVVFLLIVVALKYPLGLIFHNGLLGLLFIPFILLLSLNQGVISSLFRKKFFCYLGDISYSIYILQVPVYMWMDELFRYFRINDLVMQFYLSLVMLIILSALSFSFIDVPLREKIKRVSMKNNQR
jgi:peptidoglycan/LPS O-acetylase OafA/YrhL